MGTMDVSDHAIIVDATIESKQNRKYRFPKSAIIHPKW
jgi:hypothetical protein